MILMFSNNPFLNLQETLLIKAENLNLDDPVRLFYTECEGTMGSQLILLPFM